MNTKKTISGIIATTTVAGSFALIVLFSGCGEKQAIGTGTGALIGSAVSGKKSKGAGMLLGALAGNIIGSAIDESENKEKDRKRSIQQRKNARYRAKIDNLEDENEYLRKHATRQCPECRTKFVGAVTCTECGTKTTRIYTKKRCFRCNKVYSKNANYCAFCPKTRLKPVA